MARNRILRSVLLAAGVLLIAACASQPASKNGSLDEKYFQREANKYLKFQHDGQTVYCQSESQTASLMPVKGCITESALRQRVENYRRDRNPVQRGGPPYVATVPGRLNRTLEILERSRRPPSPRFPAYGGGVDLRRV